MKLRRLSIFDAYLLRELAGPFGFAMGAFLVFWFVNIFFLAADVLINAHAPFFLVLRFLLFRIPQSTPYAFPFACLFASLIGYGRLAADNEINALRTAGISFRRIAAPPIIAGFLVFVVSYYINDQIAPKAVDLSTRTFYQIVYRTATLPIEPQFFRKDPISGRVYYVGQVSDDRKTMFDVMIFDKMPTSGFRQIITAKSALVKDSTLNLTDASIIRFKPSGLVDGETVGRSVTVPLPAGQNLEQFLSQSNNDVYTLNSRQLAQQINAMESTGQAANDVSRLKVTLAQKLSFPFASLIAVFVAIPLAVTVGRKGRTLGVGLSIMLLFVYYLLAAATAAIGRNGAINPYLAAWLPNLIMSAVGLGLLAREER